MNKYTKTNTPHKNSHVINPKTGTPIFGRIEEISTSNYKFPSGDIFLRYGEHRFANRGFGVAHIWAEHSSELIELGYDDESKVADYVSDIITTGAKIYCEFSRMGNERVTLLQSKIGIAILEHRQDGNNNDIYSVITAFKHKQVHGVLIGSLE